MKHIFILLFLLINLNADDMQRVEAILNDIVELRSDYEDCKAKLDDKDLYETIDSPEIMMSKMNICVDKEERLQTYKKLYTNEKEKNNILKTKLNIFAGTKEGLKNKNVLKYKKLLKLKQYEIKQLKSKINLKKITEKKEICATVDLDSGSNVFPKLKLKEKDKKNKKIKKQKKELPAKKVKQVKKIVPEKTVKKKVLYSKEDIINIKPATFRLNYDSVILDDINGEKLSVWKKGKSFTSNIKTKSFIKITGYFKNKRWVKSEKDMWIKVSQVSKR